MTTVEVAAQISQYVHLDGFSTLALPLMPVASIPGSPCAGRKAKARIRFAARGGIRQRSPWC